MAPPNKGMKLTKLSAAPFRSKKCRLMPAPSRSDAGTGSQLIWNDRCQVRGGYFVDVCPPWGSETTVKAGRFDDESL